MSYRHRLPVKPSNLRLAIRNPSEPLPRAYITVPNKESGSAIISPPDAVLRDAHGTILASLVAEVDTVQEVSPPVWVIQESRLTYEPSGEGSSTKSRIEESGEGLPAFLEELGKRDGVAAVVEYLRHLTIRFNDGAGGLQGGRSFRLRVRDPFHADIAPEWLIRHEGEFDDLASAIMDFVERHFRGRLVKHARRGNVNGMENFIDVFTAVVRLLAVYQKRGVLRKCGVVVLAIKECIEAATFGLDSDGLKCDGYLLSVASNLQDGDLLREVADSVNFAGHVRAALMIAQRMRLRTYGGPPYKAFEVLPETVSKVRRAFAQSDLVEPSNETVMQLLAQYGAFSDEELSAFRKDLLTGQEK